MQHTGQRVGLGPLPLGSRRWHRDPSVWGSAGCLRPFPEHFLLPRYLAQPALLVPWGQAGHCVLCRCVRVTVGIWGRGLVRPALWSMRLGDTHTQQNRSQVLTGHHFSAAYSLPRYQDPGTLWSSTGGRGHLRTVQDPEGPPQQVICKSPGRSRCSSPHLLHPRAARAQRSRQLSSCACP